MAEICEVGNKPSQPAVLLQGLSRCPAQRGVTGISPAVPGWVQVRHTESPSTFPLLNCVVPQGITYLGDWWLPSVQLLVGTGV